MIRVVPRRPWCALLVWIAVACARSPGAGRTPDDGDARARGAVAGGAAPAPASPPAPAAASAPAPDADPHASPEPGFLGQPEQVILDRLANARVVRVKKGSGGRSLAFKLTLADGTEGYYKPEQTFSGTIWFAEIVARYLDRALEIGHVPPVVGRRLPWALLAQAAGDDTRVPEVIVGDDGAVRGAFVWWLPKPLEPAQTPPGWENWIRIEPFSQYGITPFQRASEHGAALAAFHQRVSRGEPGVQYYERVPEPDRPDRPAELSDMLLLDFLTLNIDRWGGGNGNVLTLGPHGPLIFLDNAAGFSRGPHRRSLMDGRFFPCQRFRKRTVEALARLDVAELARRMARDPLAPLLDDYLLRGIEVRKKAALAHIAKLRARFGDEAVLAF